jgi:hypothetical protein
VVTCPKADFEAIKAKQDRYAQIKADRDKKLKQEELNKPISKTEVTAQAD